MRGKPWPWLEQVLIAAGLEDITDEEWELATKWARENPRWDPHVYPAGAPDEVPLVPRYEIPHLRKVQKNFRRSTAESEIESRAS